jgi:large subunit ribosomal protein L10
MDKEQKAQVVEEIAARLDEAGAIFAIDYRGISVPQAAELRGKLREADASFNIVKNRLAKRAAEQAGREGLDEMLEGPTALTYVRGDVVTAAKAISTFNREHEVLTYKGGFMDGDALDEDRFKSLARLPALDVMHGQLVGMTAAPLTGLVRGLGSMVSGLAVALGQIQEQGLVGGDAPAEEKPAEDQPAGDPDTPGSAAEEVSGSDVESEDDSGESGEAAAAGSDVDPDSQASETETESETAEETGDDVEASEDSEEA